MRLTHEIIELRLTTPFVSARGSTDRIFEHVVRLSGAGIQGIGVARILESEEMPAASLWSDLDGIATRSGADPAPLAAAAERLHGSAGLAVDMSLRDLRAKRAATPLHRLLDLSAPRAVSGLTIGCAGTDRVIEQVAAYSAWPILKFKIEDLSGLATLEAVRRCYDGRIWVDGNGCLDVDDAKRCSYRLADLDVELFEQPTRASDRDALGEVALASPVPIVADESAVTAAGIQALPRAVHAVNVKLSKAGSIGGALSMMRQARSLGFATMLGCKTESVAGVTAAAQLAGIADYVDLDGHLDIADDPFEGLILRQGLLVLPSAHGLGFADRTENPLEKS